MVEPDSSPSFSKSRRWFIALNSIAAIVAFAALVVMVNYIASGYFKRFEWSANLRTHLSPQTIAVLKSLTNDVTATMFFDPQEEEELYGLASALLAEYRNANPKHINIRTLDRTRFDGEAKQLLAKHHLANLKDKNFVIIESGGRSKIYYAKSLAEYDLNALLRGEKNVRRNAFHGERLFTSGIFALNFPKQIKAGFLTGHGEHNPESEANDDDGYSKFAGILKDEISCECERISLQGTNTISADDCQLLVIAGPRLGSVLPNELEKIEEYLKSGGRLFALLDNSRVDAGLEKLLAKWGVRVAAETIHEQDKDRLLSASSAFLTKKITSHPITNPLLAEKPPAAILFSCLPRAVYAVQSGTKNPDAPEVKILAGTSDVASDGKQQGSFPLMVAAEQGVIKGVSAPRAGTRIVVVGDSCLLDDKTIEAGPGNHLFAAAALNWLLDRPEIFVDGIGPRPLKEYRLFIASAQLQALQWIFLGAMPALALVIGGLVWLRRRN